MTIMIYFPIHLGMILVLTVQAVVQIRQKYQRFVNQSPEPGFGILFDDIRRKDADLSLIQCIKFLLNYGFYKFGVEVRYHKKKSSMSYSIGA